MEISHNDPNYISETTVRLLEECRKAGYTRITIGVSDPMVPNSMGWGKWVSLYCVVAYNHKGRAQPRTGAFPAIWEILSKLKLSYSCANGHQAQMKTGSMEFLTKGIYARRGRWGWRKLSRA
jgi:hypothetical protein